MRATASAEGVFLTPCENNPAGRINAALPKVILAEPVERKFLKALKNSDIEALDLPRAAGRGRARRLDHRRGTRAARGAARADLGRDHGRRLRPAPTSRVAVAASPAAGLPRRVTTRAGERTALLRTVAAHAALAGGRLAVLARGLLQGALLRQHRAARLRARAGPAAKRDLRDRRAVHNHIGTVHAIALCNLAELCAGLMTDASLPRGMRWIPKGMSVRYLKKAHGTLRGVATPEIPIVAARQRLRPAGAGRGARRRGRTGVRRPHRDVAQPCAGLPARRRLRAA